MVEIKINNRTRESRPMVPVDRIKMIKAMEYVARRMNYESAFYFGWLRDGVPDGEIEPGDLTVTPEDRDPDGMIGFMAQDKQFSELMALFLWCMKAAFMKGGLTCDGVTSCGD